MPALLSAWIVAATATASPFHTSPECWQQARIYHSGPPPSDLAGRIHLIETPAPAPPGEATVSGNDAYRFWVRQPDTSQPGPWGAGIVVDTERADYPTILIDHIAQPVYPRWLNEKLIFMRISWGRIAFSDLIWDVEANELVYHETANDGGIAFQQFQEACQHRCPCADEAVQRPLPMSKPAPGERIGLLALPALFGAGEGQEVVADATPVAVYAEPHDQAVQVGLIRTRMDVDNREIGYEAGAVAVYGIQGDWYRIKPAPDSERVKWRDGWIKETNSERFYTHAALLNKRLGYLNKNWNGELWNTPEGSGQVQRSPLKTTPPRDGRAEEYGVDILESRLTDRGLWVRVALYKYSPCAGDQTILQEGWIPAYSTDGRLTVWYWSRGC